MCRNIRMMCSYHDQYVTALSCEHKENSVSSACPSWLFAHGPECSSWFIVIKSDLFTYVVFQYFWVDF